MPLHFGLHAPSRDDLPPVGEEETLELAREDMETEHEQEDTHAKPSTTAAVLLKARDTRRELPEELDEDEDGELR